MQTPGLTVLNKSSLTPLPHDAYEVKILLKEHDARVKRGVPTNPTSGILPSRSRRPKNNVPTPNQTHNQFTMLSECIKTAPPASFTVQFEISHTIPQCNPDSRDAMKVLCCKNRDRSAGFRFAFHIKDASGEMDVLCLGGAAETILGVTAQDVTTNETVQKQALETLTQLMEPGVVFEGTVRSMLGKDNKVYYILKSMFCIT